MPRVLAPTVLISAHCDLPCGVYDPAQARLEAESVKACMTKVADNDDPDFKARALAIITRGHRGSVAMTLRNR